MRSETPQRIVLERARCPLCSTWLDMYGLGGKEPLFQYHWSRRGTPSCEGSGKTLKEARELDTLRQRAHP